MRGLQIVIATLGAFMMLAGSGHAADIDYAVTVKGFCRFQTFFGWAPCQDVAAYTLFKSGRFLFHFVDKDDNVYNFSGSKDRQIDSTNLYSYIDRIETTIKDSKIVDSNATGGCYTTLTPSGDSFVSIDCGISNSKKAVFQFRMNDITHVERSLTQ